MEDGKAMRVLGVDPGSAATGWALVAAEGNRYQVEEHGVVRARGSTRADRLADLDRRFSEVVARLAPDCAAVESSFSGRNPKSSLALAECRGVLMAVLGRSSLEVSSYSPAQIKSAIVGQGRSEKHQVVYMVTHLLRLPSRPPSDAADAMAVALTHLHSSGPMTRR
jgi:crossover junction endodeoxyribonuclease RuvC